MFLTDESVGLLICLRGEEFTCMERNAINLKALTRKEIDRTRYFTNLHSHKSSQIQYFYLSFL